MNSLLIVTILSVAICILLIYKIINDKKIEIDAYKVYHQNFLQKEEIICLKHEINVLKHKELILYLIAEMLHNKEDRDVTYGAEETSTMLSKARVFTPYYGPINPHMTEMQKFIEYLSNDAWIKTFKKPASETDFKVKEWFEKEKEKLDNRVIFGKTSEGLSE